MSSSTKKAMMANCDTASCSGHAEDRRPTSLLQHHHGGPRGLPFAQRLHYRVAITKKQSSGMMIATSRVRVRAVKLPGAVSAGCRCAIALLRPFIGNASEAVNLHVGFDEFLALGEPPGSLPC